MCVCVCLCVWHGQAGCTALHYAARSGNQSCVSFLITNRANVNAMDKTHRTPLHYSAKQGHHGVAKRLIDSNANVNARDRSRYAPLHLSAQEGADHHSIASLLEVVVLLRVCDLSFKQSEWTTTKCSAF